MAVIGAAMQVKHDCTPERIKITDEGRSCQNQLTRRNKSSPSAAAFQP